MCKTHKQLNQNLNILLLFALNILIYCIRVYAWTVLYLTLVLSAALPSWLMFSLSVLDNVSVLIRGTITVHVGKLFSGKLDLSFHFYFCSLFSWQGEIHSLSVLVVEVHWVESQEYSAAELKNCWYDWSVRLWNIERGCISTLPSSFKPL